jgi:hypothetical protein
MAGEATAADVVARLKERCRAELAAKEQELAEVRASLEVAKHVIHVTDTELTEQRPVSLSLSLSVSLSLSRSLSLCLSLSLSLSLDFSLPLSQCLSHTLSVSLFPSDASPRRRRRRTEPRPRRLHCTRGRWMGTSPISSPCARLCSS